MEGEYKRGEATGEAKGLEKAKIDIAKLMLAKNKSVEEIIELTGLNKEDITNLKTI